MKTDVVEVNFDGLVGPTHHYAGLAFGNEASIQHANTISHPKEAALQSLAKMRLMLRLGIPQGIFLPHTQPNLSALASLQLSGDLQQQLETLFKNDPQRFCALFSSSAMWAANAATVTSSVDSLDDVVHITPANLMTHYHRSMEVNETHQQLKRIFNSPHFRVHEPTPALAHLSDEGAANHMRLTPAYNKKGVNVFVYGKGGHGLRVQPNKYPARQSLDAFAMIAQRHRINTHVLFFQQNPDAIDAGIFHNDVAAMSNESVFIYHEDAFLEGSVGKQVAAHCDFVLDVVEIGADDMSLQEAVETYFFNSQIVSLARNRMALIMPMECKDHPAVQRILPRIVNVYGQIQEAHYVNCRQSMQNGGGPACLRLRVPMTHVELASINQDYLLTHGKIDRLEAWVNRYYRDALTVADFLDPEFRRSCNEAMEALPACLGEVKPSQSHA